MFLGGRRYLKTIIIIYFLVIGLSLAVFDVLYLFGYGHPGRSLKEFRFVNVALHIHINISFLNLTKFTNRTNEWSASLPV